MCCWLWRETNGLWNLQRQRCRKNIHNYIERIRDWTPLEIKNANEKIIFTDKDNEELRKATQCCICEKGLPEKPTDVDHIGNIQAWLKTMGLPKYIPTRKTVEKKKNNFKHIIKKSLNKPK